MCRCFMNSSTVIFVAGILDVPVLKDSQATIVDKGLGVDQAGRCARMEHLVCK